MKLTDENLDYMDSRPATKSPIKNPKWLEDRFKENKARLLDKTKSAKLPALKAPSAGVARGLDEPARQYQEAYP